MPCQRVILGAQIHLVVDFFTLWDVVSRRPLNRLNLLSLLFQLSLSSLLSLFLSPLSFLYALCSSVVSPLYSLFSPLLCSFTLLLLAASRLVFS